MTTPSDDEDAALEAAHLRDLHRLRDGGREAEVDAVIRTYLEEWRVRFAELRRAAAVGDMRAAALTAHGLAGSSGACGARVVAELCRMAEERARQADEREVLALVERLVPAFEAARRALLAEFPGAGASELEAG